MQTLTTTKTKGITNTKLAIATLAALAAGGLAFIILPQRIGINKDALMVRFSYKVACAIEGYVTTTPPVYLPYYEYYGAVQAYGWLKKYLYNTAYDMNAARELCKRSQEGLLKQYCSQTSTMFSPAYGVALIYTPSSTATTSPANVPKLYNYQCVDKSCKPLYCP